MARQSNPRIAASSAEIHIQQMVFLVVVFPLAGLFFPAITFYWAVYAFIGIAVEYGWLKEAAHKLILHSWPQFISISMLLGIGIYTAFILKRIKDIHAQPGDRRLKTPPDNEKGTQLVAAVQRIWQIMGNGAGAPIVRWFVNFNVLARAVVSNQEQIIEVSSGLWERIVKNEWIAEMILAHEAAHLIHGDIRRFRQLDILTTAVRKVIKALLWISFAALLFAWAYEIIVGIKGQQTFIVTLIHIAGAPVVALFILLPLVVGEWVIRRYGGFITSLMELRADITAKEWLKTTGLSESGQERDPAIHQTTLMEFGHSLVSINLTHISETERFNILKSEDRMLSPKLRYFGLSLFLALLVPLNSFTPMLYNGAVDHLFVAATILALHLIVFAMLLCLTRGLHLSLRRSGIIALALFVATGLTTINAYQFGYYMTEFGAAFFAPNGFADKLLDWPTLTDDFVTSMSGMAGEFTDAFHPFAALLSLTLSCTMIYFSSVMLSNAKRRLRWLGFILISLAALLAVYDPNRKEFYPKLLSGPASWLAELPSLADLRYILPSFALLLYATIAYSLTKRNLEKEVKENF